MSERHFRDIPIVPDAAAVHPPSSTGLPDTGCFAMTVWRTSFEIQSCHHLSNSSFSLALSMNYNPYSAALAGEGRFLLAMPAAIAVGTALAECVTEPWSRDFADG
jgi:hypothetical protein